MNHPSLRNALLEWYDKNRRSLPWRENIVPYHTYLSEMMLQQTTVATVIDYFNRFILRWPTFKDLAKAPLEDVLHAWQGLGYYQRARSLHACALILDQNYGGELPQDPQQLIKLPGVGPYAAAAIASIAFEKPVIPVDGNVMRVMSRLETIDLKGAALNKAVTSHVKAFEAPFRCGDFSQALMELGALVCTPKAPSCEKCPWSKSCKAFAQSQQEFFPIKELKPQKPSKKAHAFLIGNDRGELFIRRRPLKGLLAGLYEVPTTPWLEQDLPKQPSPSASLLGSVKHTFTHFNLELCVWEISHLRATDLEILKEGLWVSSEKLQDYPIPTLMKKVLRLFQKQ